MGNTPPTGGLLAYSDYPCVANIAPSCAIEFSGRKVEQRGGDEGESTESWEIVYNLGTRQCLFNLSKRTKSSTYSWMSSPNTRDEELEIRIRDWPAILEIRDHLEVLFPLFVATLQRGEHCVLHYKDMPLVRPGSRPIFSNGEVTYTHFQFLAGGNHPHLVVTETKWKSKDRNLYTMTVTHYYVNTEDGKDVGLSLAIKNIRVSPNGNFDFVVDGPEKHPTTALLYMFDEVRRTNTWKPTYCHHCADKIIQCQRLRAPVWQTDSEDSDIEKVPASLFHRPRQNTGSLLDNHGRFWGGNKNGSINIEKLFYGYRSRRR